MKHIFLVGWLCLFFFSPVFAQDEYLVKSTETKEVNGQLFYVHQVKKHQTLYSISRAYDVEMQVIIDANPVIKNGLKSGQALLIPVKKESTETRVPPLPTLPNPAVANPPEREQPQVINQLNVEQTVIPDTTDQLFLEERPCEMEQDPKGKTYNVAFLSHFFLANPGTITVTNPSTNEIVQYKPFRYIQFYEGFLMAVDSLNKRGANLNIYVYDVDPTASGVTSLLQKPEMMKMDLIIGMVYNDCFQTIASWAKQQQIPLVSPISERELQVTGNPMVIKVRPANSEETVGLANFISQHHAYDRILLVRGSEAEAAATAKQIIAHCREKGLEVKHVPLEQLVSNLSPDKQNVIIAVTTQKSVALNILTKLNANEIPRDICVFGIPRWDEFDGMDFELMEKANTYIVSPFSLDRYKPATNHFTTLFQQHYFTFPEMLAYEGYDTGIYFLEALFKYGKNFAACLPELSQRPLMTKFKFHQSPGDGWENVYWEILRFNQYVFEPVN